jgi:hypothetical protein
MSTSLPIADELAHNVKRRDVPIPEVTLALGPTPIPIIIKREVAADMSRCATSQSRPMMPSTQAALMAERSSAD